MSAARTVVIIGAGFSGTATAVHLLTANGAAPLHLILIERGTEFGRGIAYAKQRFPYLLNVPAIRMSASSRDPDAFLRHARLRHPTIDGEAFLSRQSYGDYLEAWLAEASAQLPADVRFTRWRGEVTDLATDGRSAPITIALADGRSLAADQAVLAVGAAPQSMPREINSDLEAPVMRPSPWAAGKTLVSGDCLLTLGTGLTMVDVILEALDRCPDLRIHAISRHGLLPAGQTAFTPQRYRTDTTALRSAAGSVRALMATTRMLAAKAACEQGDWREVIAAVRHDLPDLWVGLSDRERRRFLRHVRPYWDVHRHRLPTAAATRLSALRESGQLAITAGRVLRLSAADDRAIVHFQQRGRHAVQQLTVAEVVNCTGSGYDIQSSTDPLWRALQGRGLAIPDHLGIGVQTGADGALMASDGSLSERLFYIGPLLRAQHWEATAVGELREHAERLALRLVR
jgi:uncharacterized NAD(P)/FAD-binding protein YdhS